jgi:2-dehydro-3-deoxygluconokinase
MMADQSGTGIVLTIGEVLGVAATEPGNPLLTATNLRLSTAGAEATVAVGLSRLGLRAAWMGVVGADEIGRRVTRDLRAEGVDTTFVRESDSAPTAFMLRDHRTPDYLAVTYYRSGSAGAQVGPEDVERAFAGIDDMAMLHLTGITPMLSPNARAGVRRALNLAAARGVAVSFDVNHRRSLADAETAGAVMKEILPSVDILFVGEDEAHLLTEGGDPGVVARALMAAGPREVVVKLGDRGARAFDQDGAIASVDALRVTATDVIGAGDSFVAGYLAARAEKRSLEQRLAWGTICAACTVGTRGDWEGLPTRVDLPTRAGVGQTVR